MRKLPHLAVAINFLNHNKAHEQKTTFTPEGSKYFFSALKTDVRQDPNQKYGLYKKDSFLYHRLEFSDHQENSPILLCGTNTCATINGAMPFAIYDNFLIAIEEEWFSFFLFGNKLMITVTEDLGEQLNPENFDFSAVIQKIRTEQDNKTHFDIFSFIASIEKKQDLLKSPEMAVFIKKVCLQEGANDFIKQQPQETQNFYKLLREQIFYLYQNQQINLLDIQQYLQYPTCEAQFFLGLEDIDQVIVTNEEDPKKAQLFCDNLQKAKQYLLQNEEDFEEYFNYRKNIIKFKQNLLEFLREVEKNPAKHFYFSSKIESENFSELYNKIEKTKQQTKQDLEYLQDYFKDTVKIKEDLAKSVQITYQEPSSTLKPTYLEMQEAFFNRDSLVKLSLLG